MENTYIKSGLNASNCPVCNSNKINLITPSWKNYHLEKEFYIDPDLWFADCNFCGTVMRYPLRNYGEMFTKYGEDYYNTMASGNNIVPGATSHFNHFQKNNYDSIKIFLESEMPSSNFKKWLDVGSIGYPTTFDGYDFQTIEPDKRVVNLGRKLFGSKIPWKKQSIHCATVETFKTSDVFDGILFNNSFYCITTPKETLNKAKDLLSKNGRIVITISTYFNSATQNRYDGLVSAIEDVIQGETLWIYYNEWSLRYLLESNGFSFINSKEIPAYGMKTMQAYVFERSDNVVNDHNILKKSKDVYHEKWIEFFSGFDEQTITSLAKVNHKNCIFVGSPQLFADLLAEYELNNLAGFVAMGSRIEDIYSNGVYFMSWPEMEDRIKNSDNIQYEIVICSFKYQDEIIQKLSQEIKSKAKILIPNRRSGMEFLYLRLWNKLHQIKAFNLKTYNC